MALLLAPGITAVEAAKQAMPIILRLVNLINGQKEIMQNVTLPASVTKWNVGPGTRTIPKPSDI